MCSNAFTDMDFYLSCSNIYTNINEQRAHLVKIDGGGGIETYLSPTCFPGDLWPDGKLPG